MRKGSGKENWERGAGRRIGKKNWGGELGKWRGKVNFERAARRRIGKGEREGELGKSSKEENWERGAGRRIGKENWGRREGRRRRRIGKTDPLHTANLYNCCIKTWNICGTRAAMVIFSSNTQRG